METITEEKIKELSDKIAREFKPEKIILFGSFAWGTPGPDSDVDLFIVKKRMIREKRHEKSAVPLCRDFSRLTSLSIRRKHLRNGKATFLSSTLLITANCFMEYDTEAEYGRWFEKAHDDESSAASILKHRDGAPNSVCFLSQQMANLLIKGVFRNYALSII